MRVIIRNVSSKISSKKERIALNKMLDYLNGYKRECVLAPLFKMLEASFELLVPLVMAAIIDRGIGMGDRPFILRMALVLAALAAGMPACAGVAMGIDRLLMAMLATPRIRDVTAFDFSRA